MFARKSGLIGGLLLVLGLAGFLGSTYAMKDRLANRKVPLVWFSPQRIYANEFDFLDEHHVIIRPVEDDATADGDPTAIRVTFRGETFDFPVRDSLIDARLPALQRYEDWLYVTPMVDGLMQDDDINAAVREGRVTPRLVIIARYTAPDFDPDTWGTVRRSEWEYWFLELKPEGDERFELTKRTQRELQGIAEQFLHQLDEAEDIRDIRQVAPFSRLYDRFGDDDPSDNETFPDTPLVDVYWQYQAGLLITPPLQNPRTRVTDYAMHSMGWTWPVAGVSALLMIVGIGFIGSAFVSREKL